MTLKEEISWLKSQIKAGYHVEVLRSILKRLTASENKEPPHPMHNQAVQAYKDFLPRYGLPDVFEPRQGKPLREVLYMLQGMTSTKSPEGALNAFKFILDNWDRLSPYHHKKKTITHISSNLVEILDQIKNGANKKQSNLNEAQQLANALTRKYQRSD